MRSRSRAAWLGAVIGVALALAASSSGCGDELPEEPVSLDASVEGGDEGVPVDPDVLTELSACRAYIEAYCERSSMCSGAATDCTAVLALCPGYFFSPGSTRTPEELMACAEARRTQSCEELALGLTPSCAKPGTRKAREPCWFGSQCESQQCDSPRSGACGVCSELIPDGEPCTGGDQSRTCALNSKCVDGTCQPIVVPPRLPVGSPCPVDGGPSCSIETSCIASTPLSLSGTCEVPPGEGNACAFVVRSTLEVCRPGTRCLPPDGDAATLGGICAATAGLDQPCNGDGPPCATGLVCHPATRRCVAGRGLDESCSAAEPCQSTLGCVSAVGSAIGTCKERPTVGQSCDQAIGCAAPASCVVVAREGGTERVCATFTGALGSACDEARRCAAPLDCRDGTCQLEVCPPPDAGTDGG